MKICAKTGSTVVEVTVTRDNGYYEVELDGVVHKVDAVKLEDDFFSVLNGSRSYEVSVEAKRDGYHVRHGAASRLVQFVEPGRSAREGIASMEGPEQIVSAMPGRIARVLVREGDEVEAGQGVVVVEAMKMENEIAASKAGKVSSIHVEEGQSVEGGGVLLVVE
jgi:biotin carboxyl carrier protein